MKPYPSIETVYVRDQQTKKLHFGDIRMPEVECINMWSMSEKIDGTNIRAIVTRSGIEIKGRTDKADLPKGLPEAVLAALPGHDRLIGYFTQYRGQELPEEWSVTFYGEGYGAGIQKGGVYSETKRFRVFDLLLGESWWTDDGEMRRICDELNIPTAPFLKYADLTEMPGTRDDLIQVIPHSIVATEDRGVENVMAEGIVAKPLHVLLDRHGDRVMWKLTFREFGKEAA